jgi:sugar phosphate isomerase/epimerase
LDKPLNKRDIEYARKRIFVCCPFDMMANGLLDKIIRAGINPEIGLNCDMQPYSNGYIAETAARLREAGRRATIHAAFSDLVTGASDSKIRQVSIERIVFAIDMAEIFDAGHVIFHSGYDEWRHGEHQDKFLEKAVESISILLEHASGKGIKLMLENVYEPTPWLHSEIFSRFETEFLGFCLDPGHAVVFSGTPPMEWLKAVGERLGQMHVHDNMGKQDDHLPPGRGIIDFDAIFRRVNEAGLRPVITIEPHEEDFVYPALEATGRLMSEHGL